MMNPCLVMRRAMLFAAILLSCATLGNSQPVSCLVDSQCPEGGYFCETSLYMCQECLNCHDLKREPPRSPNSCIKSVGQCGPCLKGLVVDQHGDINCVPPTPNDGAVAADDSASVGFWVGVGLGAGLLVILAAVLIYYTYKYFSSHSIVKVEMNTNMRLPMHIPSAPLPAPPEGPPPYSPAAAGATGDGPPDEDPLIKRYEPPFPAYESQDHQQVGMFNPPHYVRLPEMPPRTEVFNDENDNYPPHDEATTPSAWAPPPSYNGNNAGAALNGSAGAGAQAQRGDGAGDFSTALGVARDTVLICQPHAPIPMQEVNVNGAADEEGSDEEMPYGASAGASASFRMPRDRTGNVNVMNQIIFYPK